MSASPTTPATETPATVPALTEALVPALTPIANTDSSTVEFLSGNPASPTPAYATPLYALTHAFLI